MLCVWRSVALLPLLSLLYNEAAGVVGVHGWQHQHASLVEGHGEAGSGPRLRGGGGGAAVLLESEASVRESDNEKVVRLLSEQLLEFRREADAAERECATEGRNTKRLIEDIGSAAKRAQALIVALDAKLADHFRLLTSIDSEVVEARGALRAKAADCLQQEQQLHKDRQKAKEGMLWAIKMGERMVKACKKGSSLLSVCTTRSGRRIVEASHRATRLETRRALRRRLSRGGAGLASPAAAALLQARSCRAVSRAALARQLGGRSASGAMPRGYVRDPARLAQIASYPEKDWDFDPGNTSSDNKAASSSSSCTAVTDTADDLRSAAGAEQAEIWEKRGALDEACAKAKAPLEAEVKSKTLQLTSAQEVVAQVEGSKNELQLQMAELSEALRGLVERKAEKERECSGIKARLQEETVQVTQARKAAFAHLFPNEKQDAFKDCDVGDWTTAPCSQECLDSDGHAGEQKMTRKVVSPQDTKTLPGRLSAKCPPTEQVVKCNAVPCPVDCKMTEWSSWAACSRECGGGEQYRTRTPLRVGIHGGATCGASAETRPCNLQACRHSCELADWSTWSPCSRRCVWHKKAAPGHAKRTRAIVAEATGAGACPSLEKRTQYRQCNPFACATKVDELKCTADQDIVFVIDGSESMYAKAKGAAAEADFDQAKGFVKAVVEKSVTTGKGTVVVPTPQSGVRFGAVLFGGTDRPKILSAVTGESSAFSGAVGGAAWPKGVTPLGQGLSVAAQVFRAATGRRHSTAVILSDGHLRDTTASYIAAKRLRAQGVRVVVALVQPEAAPSAGRMGRVFCRIASRPCVDNVLRVSSWKALGKQLGRFLSVVCPVGFSP